MKAISYAINRVDVVDEVIDNEAILINLKTGSYYSLEGTACAIWGWLKRGSIASGDLAGIMERHFEGDGQTMLEDASRFLEEMVTEELLHASEDGTGSVNLAAADRVAYVRPALSKYTDMEALLLIDPIHDVTPKGWPEHHGEKP